MTWIEDGIVWTDSYPTTAGTYMLDGASPRLIVVLPLWRFK